MLVWFKIKNITLFMLSEQNSWTSILFLKIPWKYPRKKKKLIKKYYQLYKMNQTLKIPKNAK